MSDGLDLADRARAHALFWAFGTDQSRAIDWDLWHRSGPGNRVVVATLTRVIEAVVVERPPTSDVMVIEAAGRRLSLSLDRAESAGYYDTHPEERFPGCDRDLRLGRWAARLCAILAPEQLELFGGTCP